MTTYKMGGKGARETLAALIEGAPWYARSGLERTLERGKPIKVTVVESLPRHTDSQRSYYHMGVDLLARHLGMTHDECHGQILIEWGGSETVTVMGREILVPRTRSSKLPTVAYSELIETLLRVAAWAGVVIPDPEQMSA